jgi:uncharacterized protein involved in exopolysaccharide biosynthesis
MENNQVYLNAFLKKWWVIVIAIIVAAGLGLAYSLSQEPVYQAEATYIVTPTTDTSSEGQIMLNSINTLAQRTSLATTYCEVLRSNTVYQQTIRRLEVPAEVSTHYETNCVVLPDSLVLQLVVSGPSPAVVADLANGVGDEGLTFIKSLQDVYEIRPLDPASWPDEMVSPNHVTNVVLSAIIGGIAGVVFIFLQQMLVMVMGKKEPATTAVFPTTDELATDESGR